VSEARLGKLDGPAVDADEVRAGRGHEDLRDWLRMVDALGELRVLEGVGWEEDIGRVTEMLHHTDGAPAVLFDRIPGYPDGFRVLVNAQGERSRLAVTLGLPTTIGPWELIDRWQRLMDGTEPVAPEMVPSGPVTENVMEGDDVDLLAFPTPLWHPEDGGRYLGTGDCVITKGPEGDWVNMGTYRVQVHDRRTTGLYISPGKHGRLHRDAWFERGEPMPAVVLCGEDPLLFLTSCLEMAPGLSEMEWAGGVRGRAVPCVEGRHTGLPIPAHAEIAVEGFLRPDRMAVEGPFGEWTGYYASGGREEPVFEVAAVYFRDDPIILGVPPEKPPYEAHRFRQYLRSANLLREIRLAGVPDVTAAWCHGVGGCRLFNVVAVHQRYPGHATQAGQVATSCRTGAYLGRITVVVDDDVDVADVNEVIWAICTRADPERDYHVLRRTWSGPLDPAIDPDHKGLNSRVIIDATRPWEWRDQFPPAIGPEPAEKQRTRDRWSWVL
jgi:4-hydroxy-3-polyprenylbenzoate decarboxylase